MAITTATGRLIGYHRTEWLDAHDTLAHQDFYRFLDTGDPAGTIVTTPLGKTWYAVHEGMHIPTHTESTDEAILALAGLL